MGAAGWDCRHAGTLRAMRTSVLLILSCLHRGLLQDQKHSHCDLSMAAHWAFFLLQALLYKRARVASVAATDTLLAAVRTKRTHTL